MKNYIYTGVMALALMGLTACSSDSESEITPQKRETVKTQFAIAVPTGSTGKDTRMSSDAVQAGNQFNGFKKLYLLSQSKAITASDDNFTSCIALDLNSAEITNSTQETKVYNDVEVPTGTTYFLAYAESNYPGSKNVTGVLNMTPASFTQSTGETTYTTNGISFALEGRQSTPDKYNSMSSIQADFVTLLNQIDDTDGWEFEGHAQKSVDVLTKYLAAAV